MTSAENHFPLKIAVDVGFHSIKSGIVYNGKPISDILPAVVGVGETSLGALQSGLTRQKKLLPDILSTNGQEYLVGSHVALYARPIERMDFDRVTYSPELRALLYTALGRLLQKIEPDALPEPGIDIGLIIALPVQVLQGPDSKTVVESLGSWLMGEHRFQLNNRNFSLRVFGVKAMAQPIGSFFEYGLDVQGQWSRSSLDLRADIAVLDQGFNTLDLIQLSGGQIVRRYTGGETIGQRRAATIMQSLLQQKTNRRFSLHEADYQICQVCCGHWELFANGERIDLRPMARHALDVAAGEVRTFLSQIWEDAKGFDRILLTGGGIIPLSPMLRSAYPNAIEMIDPVTANARGLAKFCQRFGVMEFPKKVA